MTGAGGVGNVYVWGMGQGGVGIWEGMGRREQVSKQPTGEVEDVDGGLTR